MAAVFLAVLLSIGVWLSVSPTARAAFFSWVREVYEEHIVYRFANEKSTDALSCYRPGRLPDGYQEEYVIQGPDTTDILYTNASNVDDGVIFSYYSIHKGSALAIVEPTGESHAVLVNGLPGHFYPASEEGEANSLIWIDDDRQIIFSLSAFLPEHDMMHIAESVKLVKTSK